VLKDNIGDLGSAKDRKARQELRVNDNATRFNVETARRIIYQDGYVVNSDAVNALLKEDSLTPTEASV
jgi:hypothetical protein